MAAADVDRRWRTARNGCHLDHERAVVFWPKQLRENSAGSWPVPAMGSKRTWSTPTRERWDSFRATVNRAAALTWGVGVMFVSGKVRMVTHVDVDDDGLALALDALARHRRDRANDHKRQT